MTSTPGGFDVANDVIEEKSENRWDDLPDCLIWKIMNKFHWIDWISSAAVWKTWWRVFKDYAFINHKYIGASDGSPWLAIVKSRGDDIRRLSLVGRYCRVSTEKIYTIQIDDISNYALLLCSYKGWFLFADNLDKPSSSIFLFNFCDMLKIPMPNLDLDVDLYHNYVSAISTDNGICVAIAYQLNTPSDTVMLRIAHPGDYSWTKWLFVADNSQSLYIRHMHILGEYIYLFSVNGLVIKFDMLKSIWYDLTISQNESATCDFVMECDGEFLRAILYWSYYRLNEKNKCWEQLSLDEAKQYCWFLDYTGRSCFVIKGKEKGKVFAIHAACTRKLIYAFEIGNDDSHRNRFKHIQGKSQSYICDFNYHWVDMG